MSGHGPWARYAVNEPPGCAIGLLGHPVAESGRSGHGDRGHGRGDRRRRAFMLTTLLTLIVGRAILPASPTRGRHHLVTGEQGESA